MTTSPTNPSTSGNTAISWVALALALGTLVYLYGFFGYLTAYGPHLSVFQSMAELYGYEEWQHCVLVPFLVGFLVWYKRENYRGLSINPAPVTGILIILLAFAFFWLSYRVDQIYVAFGSIQFMTAGLILLFGGFRWMQALFFPWLFLGFAYPLFFLDNLLAFPLRIVMSQASNTVLNLIGIAAVQVGTSIQSAPDPISGLASGQRFQVDVADPCSGIRSLFALMMVSALFGYFTLASWWKRGVLFALAAPLAVLGNLVRILILTLGILMFGTDFAIGTMEDPSIFHIGAGFFVFIVALSGMILIAGLLRGDYNHLRGHFTEIRQTLAAPKPQDRPVDTTATQSDIY